MPKRDKTQWPAAPLFVLGAFLKSAARGGLPGTQWFVELQLSTSPHPAGQAHIRYYAANHGMAIAPQLFGSVRIPKVNLVIKGRQRIPRHQRDRFAQSRLQRPRAGHVQNVVNGLHFPCHGGRLGRKLARSNPDMTPKLDALDHLVLTVADIGATVAFYRDVLGMEAEVFHPPDGSTRTALKFGAQKINLHQQGAEFDPKALRPGPGTADLCFLSAVSLEDWQAHLAQQGTAVEDGPVARTGATGPLMSIYIRDPDGNLIEISNPT